MLYFLLCIISNVIFVISDYYCHFIYFDNFVPLLATTDCITDKIVSYDKLMYVLFVPKLH